MMSPVLQDPLHALSRLLTSRIMHVTGKVHVKAVSIPIDGGSSHNFIMNKLVQRMGSPIQPTNAFQVLVWMAIDWLAMWFAQKLTEKLKATNFR